MKGKQAIRIIVGIVVATLVLGLAVAGYGGWRLYKGLKWVEEQNAKADELPTLEELIGPPIPDEENAALVYQRAFAAFDLTDEDEKVLSGERDPSRPGLRIYDLPKLEGIIAKNEPALALLRQAAAMEKCRFPVDWSDPVQAEFPHLPQMRRAGRLLAAKVRLLGKSQEMHAALGLAATGLNLGEAAKKGVPTLMGFLLELYVDSVVLHGVEGAMDAGHCPQQSSASLRARLARMDLVEASVEALEGERAWGLLAMEQMHEVMLSQLAETANGSRQPPIPPESVPRWVTVGSRAWYTKFMAEYLELAPLPYRQSHQRGPELEGRMKRIPIPYRLTCGIMLPALSGSVRKRDETRARIEMCVVALDLKAYKFDRGSYPATLDELPEASEKGYAEDVFSGEPLKYRREGEGFMLYSFGKDLDDDGGLPLGREVNGKPEWADGDLVWRCSK